MVRNLIYHLTPMGNWMWNVKQLQERLHIFNGQKLIAIATGKGLEYPEIVEKQFPDCTFIQQPNDRDLREVATFVRLLQHVESERTNEITFYGHSKGVTKSTDPAVKRWTELLYEHNLDRYREVEVLMRQFHVVGSFRRYGIFHNFKQSASWHYSGTFFWFKNQELFTRNWKEIKQHQYGAEEYIPTHFRFDESGCLFADGIENPYDIRCLQKLTPKMEIQLESKLHNANRRQTRSA